MVPGTDRIRFIAAWQQAAEHQGRENGPTLLALPVDSWRATMNANPALRTWGTLKFLVEAVHDGLHYAPATALERAAVIIDYAADVDVPEPGFRQALQGQAWKEYAKCLRLTGNLRLGLEAAIRAQGFLASPTFAHEAAKARLVEAQIRHEMDEHDVAIEMSRQCASVFREYDDSRSYVFSRMIEAGIFFGRKQFGDARKIFCETAEEAETRGDKHTLGACLHNTAECARELGDITTARKLYARAVAVFDELGTITERPRVRWAYGLSLAAEGRIDEAISEIFKARAELLHLGINADAAVATLDVVRLRHGRDEDVAELCTQLVATFSEAGMTQNAIEALAYVREQSRRGRLTTKKIAHVQDYLRHVQRSATLFVRPPEEEEADR